jgi:hypothetical protein
MIKSSTTRVHENGETPIIKSVILTYIDTLIREVLVIGVPTIVITDLNRWHFRPDCQDVIDLLLESKVCLLHH